MKRISFYSILTAMLALIGAVSCKPAEELSSEAGITAFTFDTSVGANSIVTSQPSIQGNSITFTVSFDASEAQLAALVPTVTVSEGATVSPASGSAVDFSKGPVTYTVTAQDGVTTATYTAAAEIDAPADLVSGTYNGTIDVIQIMPIVTDQEQDIILTKTSDETVDIAMNDVSVTAFGMTIEIGDIVMSASLSETDSTYSITGEQNLTLPIGDSPVKVEGTLKGDMLILDFSIASTMGELGVEFEGTKAAE